MIVARQNKSRAVSLADAMRHGGVDRIEHEKLAEFKEDNKHARNTHSAIFAEVKVDEQLGIIRVTRVVNAVAAVALSIRKPPLVRSWGAWSGESAWPSMKRQWSTTPSVAS